MLDKRRTKSFAVSQSFHQWIESFNKQRFRMFIAPAFLRYVFLFFLFLHFFSLSSRFPIKNICLWILPIDMNHIMWFESKLFCRFFFSFWFETRYRLELAKCFVWLGNWFKKTWNISRLVKNSLWTWLLIEFHSICASIWLKIIIALGDWFEFQSYSEVSANAIKYSYFMHHDWKPNPTANPKVNHKAFCQNKVRL